MGSRQFSVAANPLGAIGDVIGLEQRQALIDQATLLSRLAASVEGVETLRLPPARITAWHETGHAILHAATSIPIASVRIWPEPAYGGFSGRCSLSPGYKPPILIAHEDPTRAIIRACSTLAGFVGEHVYSGSKVAIGSSIDEQVTAANLVAGAALGLGMEEIALNLAVASIVCEILKEETAIATRLHRQLLSARKVGGKPLRRILADVKRRDLPALVIAKARSFPPVPPQALEELQRMLKRFEVPQ